MSKKVIIADFTFPEESHYFVGLQTELPYYQMAHYLSKVLFIDFYRCIKQKVYHEGGQTVMDYYMATLKEDRFFLLTRQDCMDKQSRASALSKVNYVLSIFSALAIENYKTVIEKEHHFFITPVVFNSSKVLPLLFSLNDCAILPDFTCYPVYPDLLQD